MLFSTAESAKAYGDRRVFAIRSEVEETRGENAR